MSSTIIFLSKEQCLSFIMNDSDKYFQNLTQYDLLARSVNTINEYKNSIISLDFSEIDTQRIKFYCDHIDKYLFKNNICGQWVFALTSGACYENGFPHTRSNIIFLSSDILLSDDKQLLTTLIHEKIHIYQRLFKQKVQNDLLNMGYKVISTRSYFLEINNKLRSNPDLDEYIYSHPELGPMFTLYSSDNPQNISDVIIKPNNNNKYDHPFELMAYEVSTILSDKIYGTL